MSGVKKKILFINPYFGRGSTGKIVKTLFENAEKHGWDPYAISGFDKIQNPKILSLNKTKSDLPIYISILKTRITGFNGFDCNRKTKKIIKFIEKVKPDVINIHNMHGGYLNLSILIDFIKKKHIPAAITLHDCWLMTGNCPHFVGNGCTKWKTECKNCEHIKTTKYPKSWFFDRSNPQFLAKKEAFTGMADALIMGPCKWITNMSRQSVTLGKIETKVVYNGIDFYKIVPKENEKIKRIVDSGKKILLFVSTQLSESKGILDLDKFGAMVSNDFTIVAIGSVTDSIKAKTKFVNFIGTFENSEELSYAYRSAYAFINLTHDDTFPTTNIESLQCGLPVVSYQTGGCSELEAEGIFYVAKENTPKSAFESFCILQRNKKSEEAISEYGKKYTVQEMVDGYFSIFDELSNKEELDS